MATGRVLVVDDDQAVGEVLVGLLRRDGHDAEHVASARAALALAHEKSFDAVLSDVRMPEIDGLELLDALGRQHPGLPVVLLTAHGSVPLAVDALRRGAADFLLKPFDGGEVAHVVSKVVALSQGSSVPPRTDSGAKLVGSSEAMREVASLVKKAAGSNATVLVRGETGTGKELVARAVHAESARRSGPYVRVHCAALPETLLETELFGHEKGAFTGASGRKPGRVELAQGGSLFLDEIGDVSPAVQVKLLRVLQDKEFERVGGTSTIKADVRFIAATHRDLEGMVAEGKFREDLFYRLNVIPILVPPLRDRPGDVTQLVEHFVAQAALENQRSGITLDAAALALLAEQPWPGNVRQLANFVERLVVLGDSPTIRVSDVERELARMASPRASPATTLDSAVRQTERELLRETLVRVGNNRSAAARVLNVSRRTLYNKLRDLGLE